MKKKSSKRKAFTIVELVIVIAVIGILATVLVPTFGDIIDKAQLSAARSDATNLYKQYVAKAAGSGEIAETLAIHAGKDRYFVFANGTLQEKVYSSVKEVRADHAGAKLLQAENGSFEVSALGYSKVVLVGNSWTLHPPHEDIWFEDRGMAASVPKNDFASLFEVGLKAYPGKVSVDRINVANWERWGDAYIHEVDKFLSSETDLIVLRFGENLSTRDEYYDRLLNYIDHMKALAPNAEFVVCTTGLDYSLAATTKDAGIAAGARIAETDFSSRNNYARVGQYIQFDVGNPPYVVDGYHQISHGGVAGHPSDVGMAVVANSVLSAIGYDQIHVTYEIKYEGIDSAGYERHTQWVRNGLVTVNSSTGPISVVTDSGRQITDIKDHGNGFYTFYMPEEGVTVSANN